MKIRRNEPRVHHALQVASNVVVDEQEIRPHAVTARLSFEEHEFIPERSGVESIQPSRVKQHKEQQNRRESDIPVNDRFDENRDVFHIVFFDVVEQNDAVEEAADEEERLHQVPTINHKHGKEPVITLKPNAN
jgi:hypothetical protein